MRKFTILIKTHEVFEKFIMNLTQRIQAFSALGDYIRNLTPSACEDLSNNAANENPWFTHESVERALSGVSTWLTEPALTEWVSSYPASLTSRTIAVVMAGNLPLVGFHDLLAVLLSGHSVLVKLSSKDRFLPSHFIDKLTEIEPAFGPRITQAEQLKSFDAVIATGSDNSARYFEYYFGKYPHIIRKNRTSVAILSGKETQSELESLGKDVFSYFGLGCRSVSKLFVPSGYSFNDMFGAFEPYSQIINHHKYANNYDYQKSILLINSVPFLDNGFLLLQESKGTVSPISVLYHEPYENDEDLVDKLAIHKEKIQVVVGNNAPAAVVSFGCAQNPGLMDYADNVDTMAFLTGLK